VRMVVLGMVCTLYCAVHVQSRAVLYGTVLYCTVQYGAVQYCNPLYSKVRAVPCYAPWLEACSICKCTVLAYYSLADVQMSGEADKRRHLGPGAGTCQVSTLGPGLVMPSHTAVKFGRTNKNRRPKFALSL